MGKGRLKDCESEGATHWDGCPCSQERLYREGYAQAKADALAAVKEIVSFIRKKPYPLHLKDERLDATRHVKAVLKTLGNRRTR